MTNTLTLFRRRHVLYLCMAVAILTFFGIAFFGFQPFAGGVSFEDASEEYVTNCDLQAGCGMVPVVTLSVVILSLSAITVFARERYLRWRNR